MRTLWLPASRLALQADALLKYGADDCVMGRYPAESILGIRLEKSRDYSFGVAGMLLLTGLAVLAHRYIPSPGWAGAAVFACAAACAVVFLGMAGRHLVIETTQGTVRYQVSDLDEEAEGFVVSARFALASHEAEREQKLLTQTGP